MKLPKILIYDIETTPLKAWIWRLGDQAVRHGQLDVSYNTYSISTLAYKWYGEAKTYCLTGKGMIESFDKLVKQADVVLGKNSDRFDVKHINAQRLMQGLPPMPQWLDISDDLEKQLRRYFSFPSMSLDYISSMFGTGGKVKMEMQDWIDIENAKLLKDVTKTITEQAYITEISKSMFKQSSKTVFSKGRQALKKMIFYNKKDVTDTEYALKKVMPHIKLRYNAATDNDGKGCIACGSKKISPEKVIIKGKTSYQEFYCMDHEGYAGKTTFRYDKYRHKIYGKMG